MAEQWGLLSSASGVQCDGGQRLRFKKTSSKEWKCSTRGTRGWNEGRHMWFVSLDSGADGISVGISRKHIDLTDADRNCHLRYDIYGGEGCAVTPTADWEVFGEALKDGDVLMVGLDLNNRCVYYGRNGVWLTTPVFTDVPPGTWYPYFALQHKGCTFTVTKQVTY